METGLLDRVSKPRRNVFTQTRLLGWRDCERIDHNAAAIPSARSALVQYEPAGAEAHAERQRAREGHRRISPRRPTTWRDTARGHRSRQPDHEQQQREDRQPVRQCQLTDDRGDQLVA